MSKNGCIKCERLQAQLQVLDAALGLASEFTMAVGEMIPKHPEELSPEIRDAWQKIVNEIIKSAEFADVTGRSLRENWKEVKRGFGKLNLADLEEGQFVTASGLRDGGFIVWRTESDHEHN